MEAWWLPRGRGKGEGWIGILGFKNLKENREETKNGLLNKTGEKLRELMPLMTKND